MSNPTPIDVSGLPVSYMEYIPQAKTRLSNTFEYGLDKNLASIHFANIDSLNGTISIDSGSYFFNVDPARDLPAGYWFDRRAGDYSLIETHLLYFNSHNQLLKDSGVTASGYTPFPHTAYWMAPVSD